MICAGSMGPRTWRGPDRPTGWRRVRRLGPVAVGLLAGLVLLLLVEVFTGFVQLSMLRLAIDGGRHTTAVITALNPENHGACEYIFTVGGRRIRGSDTRCVGRHRVGEDVSVTYLPTDPSIVTMDDPVTRFWGGSVVSLLAAIIVGVAVGFGTVRRRKGPWTDVQQPR